MLFCMFCITYILIWTNLVPTFRLLFFDFSSAFNTIQPQLLAEELLKMKVSIPAILWVLDYLTYRPQFVKSGFELSNIMFTNTGLYCHPLFYFLFIKKKSKKSTVHCRLQEFSWPCPTDKFADDTGLLMNDDNSHYRQEVDRFVDWWDTNCLVLNVGKTKEMIIDFRRKKPNDNPIMIKGEAVCWTGGQILLFRLKTNLPGTKTPMNSWRKSTFVSFVLENLDHSEWMRIFCRCFSCPLLAVF